MQIDLDNPPDIPIELQHDQSLIDNAQLELDQDIFKPSTPSSKNPTTTPPKSLHFQVLTKWNNLLIDTGPKDNHSAVESWRRSVFIAQLFEEHFLKPLLYVDSVDDIKLNEALYMELFMQCLNEYSTVSLLDDFHHITSVHGDVSKSIQCPLYEAGKECIGELLRKYREREQKFVAF